MPNRIEAKFVELKQNDSSGFIPFIVAGDPDLATTAELIFELERQNAAIIELGVPFSDPVADGVTIQAAAERSLKNGTTLKSIFGLVADVRHRGCQTPIILFSYFNPILQFGLENFAADAVEAGVDGVLITDLIIEESSEFIDILNRHHLSMIMLAAPTTSDQRLSKICSNASGFVYAISRAGVTGEKTDLSREAQNLVERIRKFTSLPIAVGFGITNQAQIDEVNVYADAAVVGSAIVKEIERAADRAETVARVRGLVENFVRK